MKITAEKLKEILDKHLKWYLGHDGGERGQPVRGRPVRGRPVQGQKFLDSHDLPRYRIFYRLEKAVLLDSKGYRSGHVIVKLRICEDAKRSSSTGRKCRCDKAEVLEIQALDGGKVEEGAVVSDRDRNFHYIPGTIVSVPDFDENRWKECSTGIHFFANRQESVDYAL